MFVAATAALAIAGGSFVISAPADAAPPHWRHSARVCHPVYKTRTYWKHGRRHVVKVKVGERCHWRRW
jgi:hypothetical protein